MRNREIALRRNKPFSIPALVLGIASLVFGAYTLIVSSCQGSVLLFFYALFRNISRSEPEVQRLATEGVRLLNNYIPGLVPFMVTSYLVSIILSLFLIISGIGLILMQNWGRVLSIVYAILQILAQIATLVFLILVIIPGVNRAQRDLEVWIDRQADGQPGFVRARNSPFQVSTIIDYWSTLADITFKSIYAIALLVVLFLPVVSRELTGQPIGHVRAPPEFDDFAHRRDPDPYIRDPDRLPPPDQSGEHGGRYY